MSLINVLDPTGVTRGGELPLAPRPADLHDASIAFYDNGKWNAGLLLETIAETVHEQLGGRVKTSICRYDNLAQYAADAESTEYIKDLARFDAVVLALGD